MKKWAVSLDISLKCVLDIGENVETTGQMILHYGKTFLAGDANLRVFNVVTWISGEGNENFTHFTNTAVCGKKN